MSEYDDHNRIAHEGLGGLCYHSYTTDGYETRLRACILALYPHLLVSEGAPNNNVLKKDMRNRNLRGGKAETEFTLAWKVKTEPL